MEQTDWWRVSPTSRTWHRCGQQDRRAGHRAFGQGHQGLADSCVSVDLINLSPDQALFTIKASDAVTASEVLSSLGANFTIEKGFAKVSAVGAGMRGVPGVMATIVEALSDTGVSIYQTADSHQSISCLVRMEDMEAAAKALHDRFGLAR